MKQWWARVVFGACVWGLLVGYARLLDRQPHYVPLAAAVAAVLTVVWLCTDAYAVARPPQWQLYFSRLPSRTFDPRFSRLSQELAEAPSRRAAAVAVHTSVAAVAERILLDKYGVDRDVDPEAAQSILGEETTGYLAADPASERDVFSNRLFDVLTRLESL